MPVNGDQKVAKLKVAKAGRTRREISREGKDWIISQAQPQFGFSVFIRPSIMVE